jgi:hypothetical protein
LDSSRRLRQACALERGPGVGGRAKRGRRADLRAGLGRVRRRQHRPDGRQPRLVQPVQHLDEHGGNPREPGRARGESKRTCRSTA